MNEIIYWILNTIAHSFAIWEYGIYWPYYDEAYSAVQLFKMYIFIIDERVTTSYASVCPCGSTCRPASAQNTGLQNTVSFEKFLHLMCLELHKDFKLKILISSLLLFHRAFSYNWKCFINQPNALCFIYTLLEYKGVVFISSNDTYYLLLHVSVAT
jgi:hypothetical protein